MTEKEEGGYRKWLAGVAASIVAGLVLAGVKLWLDEGPKRRAEGPALFFEQRFAGQSERGLILRNGGGRAVIQRMTLAIDDGLRVTLDSKTWKEQLVALNVTDQALQHAWFDRGDILAPDEVKPLLFADAAHLDKTDLEVRLKAALRRARLEICYCSVLRDTCQVAVFPPDKKPSLPCPE